MKPSLADPDSKAFWDFVFTTARKVRRGPKWKQSRVTVDDRIKAESEVLEKNQKLKAAPQEERPETVYLAMLGERGNEYVSVVFYSRARAKRWLDEKRENPRIVARLDAISCADGDAERVP